MSFSFEKLISRIERWAISKNAIKSAIIIGSRARVDLPADEWSDLDLILLTDTPDDFMDSEDWLEEISPYSITFLEKTAVGNGMERRVMFEPHFDVDFVILTPEQFSTMLQLEEVQLAFLKGFKILFDRTEVTSNMKTFRNLTTQKALPSQKAFDNLVQDFWYHVVWISKKMLRGELWTANECLDSNLKDLLRRMAEWHAISVLDNQPWHNGRFIEKWADPRLTSSFPVIFATYDRRSMIVALKETMEIFRILAKEVSGEIDLHYPDKADQSAVLFLNTHEEKMLFTDLS